MAPEAIPVLPATPLLERVLLGDALPVAVFLLACGVVARFALAGRGRVKEGNLAAVGLVALAVAAWVTGRMIVTDREAIRTRSRELVGAVARLNAAGMSAVLVPEARVIPGRFAGSVPDVRGREAMIAEVRSKLEGEFRLREWGVEGMRATVDGPGLGRTHVQVRAVPEAWGVPSVTWWRLDWRRDGDGWRCTAVEPLSLGIGGR